MKESLLLLLQEKFAGVRTDGLSSLARSLALTVKTEDEAKKVVDGITKDGVETFVEAYRREVDSEVTKATKTFESNLKNKFDFVAKGEPKVSSHQSNTQTQVEQQTKPATDVNSLQDIITKAIKQATEPLQQKIGALESKDVFAKRKGALEKELDKMPKSVRGRIVKDFEKMQFQDNDAFNSFLEDTKKDVASLAQELSNEELKGHGVPAFGKRNENGVSSEVVKYLESTKNKQEEGKKI